MQDVFQIFPNGRRAGVFVAGEGGDRVQRLFLIVESAFQRNRHEPDLLLDRVVKLRPTQLPHISQIEDGNNDQRHSYTGSEEQQFAANSQPANSFVLQEMCPSHRGRSESILVSPLKRISVYTDSLPLRAG